jgi:hypothetical protein
MEKDTTQIEKLQEKVEQMNLALDSVPNSELAKSLLQGKIKDAVLVKLKVNMENLIGLITILISTYNKKILVLHSLAGISKTLVKTNTFEDSKTFTHKFVDATQEGNLDAAASEQIGRAVYYALPQKVLNDQINNIVLNKLDKTIELITEKIKEQTKSSRVTVSGEVEKVSSVSLRYKNPIDDVLKPIQSPHQDTSSSNQKKQNTDLDNFLKTVSKEYSKIIDAKIVSVANGVYFDFLELNEIVFFNLPMETEEERKIAEEFGINNLDNPNGEIEAKFVKVISIDNEYHIFGEVKDVILFHAVENAPLKMKVLKTREKSSVPKKDTGSRYPYLLPIIGGVFLFIIIFIAVLMIQK